MRTAEDGTGEKSDSPPTMTRKHSLTPLPALTYSGHASNPLTPLDTELRSSPWHVLLRALRQQPTNQRVEISLTEGLSKHRRHGR